MQFPFFWRVRDGDETDTAIFPIYCRGALARPRLGRRLPALHPRVEQERHDHPRRPDLVSRAPRRRQTAGLFPLFAYGKKVAGAKTSSWFGMPGVFADHNDFTGVSTPGVSRSIRFTRPDGYAAGLHPARVRLAPRHRLEGADADLLSPVRLGARLLARRVHAALRRPRGQELEVRPLPALHGGPRRRRRLAHGPVPAVLGLAQQGPRDAGDAPRRLLPTPSRQARLRGPVLLSQRRRDDLGRALPDRLLRQEPHTRARTDLDGPAALPRHPSHRRSPARRVHAAHLALPQRRERPRSSACRSTSTSTATASRAPPACCRCSCATAPTCKSTGVRVFPPLLAWWRSARRPSRSTDAVVFPLFWRFGGHDSTTVFAPLVWDFKRGDSRTTVVFPLFAALASPASATAHTRAQRLLPQGPRRTGRQLAPRRLPARAGSAARVSTTSSGTSSRGSSATRGRAATVTFVSSGSSTSRSSRCRRRTCRGSARPPTQAREVF